MAVPARRVRASDRCWSQFRRWTANGTWARLLTELHQEARGVLGRGERLPSLVTIDSSLARGASNGGATFHDQGGPGGWTNGAKRVIAVDVTGLPLAARVTPASVTESETVGLLLGDMADAGQNGRLDIVLVDRGTGARQAQRHSKTFGVEVRRVFHDPRPVDQFGRGLYVPLPFAWRVETAHGTLGRSRRLAKSFENTTASATAWLQVACIAAVLVLFR